MNLSKSFLKLIFEFKELPFGNYTIKIKYNEKTECFWYVSYTDVEGIDFFPNELPLDCDFDYEIYSETFMTEAIRFYNHELEMNL